MKRISIGVFLSLLILAVCCLTAMAQDKPAQPVVVPTVQPTAPTTQPVAPVVQPTTAVYPPAEYKIQQDDVMRIVVVGEPNLQVEQMVDPQGYISVPFVGQVMAKGLTQQELTNNLEKLMAKYLVDPKVNVVMSQFRRPKVQVTGQVNRPGQFEFKDGDRVVDAIALAASFTDLAYLEGATITHKGGTPILLNLKKVYTDKDMTQNEALQDGDTIYIPEDTTNWYFVLGQVARPGKFRIKDKVYVVDAISNSGFTDRTSTSSCYIIRGGGTGAATNTVGDKTKEERIKIDLKGLLKKGDMSQNLALKPGDVVYLPETGKPNWNAISGMLSAIVNIGYLPRVFGL